MNKGETLNCARKTVSNLRLNYKKLWTEISKPLGQAGSLDAESEFSALIRSKLPELNDRDLAAIRHNVRCASIIDSINNRDEIWNGLGQNALRFSQSLSAEHKDIWNRLCHIEATDGDLDDKLFFALGDLASSFLSSQSLKEVGDVLRLVRIVARVETLCLLVLPE